MTITLEDFFKQLEEQRDDPCTVFYDAGSIAELSEEDQAEKQKLNELEEIMAAK